MDVMKIFLFNEVEWKYIKNGKTSYGPVESIFSLLIHPSEKKLLLHQKIL
jgi:hypothetical protein